MAVIRVSWQQYAELTLQITRHLDELGYRPDIVVGIARGGLPLMVSLASHYSTRQIGVVYVQKTATEERFSQMLPEAISKGYSSPYTVENRNVLLVDNICQTGQTIQAASREVFNLGAKSIKTVCLYKHKSNYGFDCYSPLDVEENDWVVFPWDKSTIVE